MSSKRQKRKRESSKRRKGKGERSATTFEIEYHEATRLRPRTHTRTHGSTLNDSQLGLTPLNNRSLLEITYNHLVGSCQDRGGSRYVEGGSWIRGFLVSWYLGFLVSWLLGFLVSWFLSFLVSWFQSVLVSWFQSFWVAKFPRFTKCPLHVFWKILMIPYPRLPRIY